MIYLIADTSKYEWPLATAGSPTELAKMCGVAASYICTIITQKHVTKVFNGIPARIYKFPEDEA